MNRRQAGRKGGQRTLALYGRDHMKAIGKRGYQATLACHWQGDALAYRRWLITRGWNAFTNELAGREIDRRIGTGEATVCIELPYLDEDQDICRGSERAVPGPDFFRSLRSRRQKPNLTIRISIAWGHPAGGLDRERLAWRAPWPHVRKGRASA